MKILHIVAYFNEIWKYQENYLAEIQSSNGHDVLVVTSNLNFPYPNYQTTALNIIGPRKKALKSFTINGFRVQYLKAKFEFSGRVWLNGLTETIKSFKPDLIVCHGVTQPATIKICRLKWLNCPIIADEHMLFSDIENSRIKQIILSLFGKLVRKLLSQRVTKFVAIANGTQRVLEKVLHLPTEKIQMIPLGTDTSLFKPDFDQGLKFRIAQHIDVNSILIGYTGKIEPRKQLEVLINVLANFEHEHLHLLIVGNMEGVYGNVLKNELKKLKIPFTLLPSQPQSILPAIYNACNFMVWPAHQTISMMDAAACGKAFICANYLQERLQQNQGIGIVPGNANELSNALRTLIDSPELCLEMGQNALNWAIQTLSWEAVNKRFINT